LGILFPPRNSAPLTVGLPALAHRTLTGFPCSARVRCGWGRASSIPRGRQCPHGRVCSTTAACRITAARPLSPRCCIPAREVMLTRHHQGFPVSRPVPSLPLTCDPQPERGPLGFPASFTPGRYRPRMSRWGQVTDTNPESHHRHQPASTSTDSLLTCDLTSQALRIPHGSLSSVTCAPSPCGPALPVSRLAGRYSCDYYGHSVALGLASRRRSHVHQRYTSKRDLGVPFVSLNALTGHRSAPQRITAGHYRTCRRGRRRFQASFRRVPTISPSGD
jgi:hypothetical protein